MKKSLFSKGSVDSKRIIYTPSQFAKSSLLYLQEAGELNAQRPHESSRNGLDSFLLFLVVKGSGTLNYCSNTYNLKKGSCVFIDCSLPYTHKSSEDLWTLKWVHFNGYNMSQIYGKYLQRGGKCCFESSYFSQIEDLVENIYLAAESDSYIRDMNIFSMLAELTSLIMHESRYSDNRVNLSEKQREMQSVKSYIDEHFNERITLDLLSQKFYINKFYLTRIFKEQFGLTLNNYILQVRITSAKRLLRFSEKNEEEIAIECGFSDLNYFCRVFKKIEGISPGEYRKRW